MIDLTKKWKTRDGEPVTNLALAAHDKLSGLICGKNWGAYATWCSDTGESVGLGRKSGWDLIPAEDEPAAPAQPPLDARLYLIGCAISGAIASTDADINPDPRLTAKWAMEFADEVLARLAEQKDGAA